MKIFQVLNLTELELDRLDVRVGLSGPLYYMDGSSQAVRQLRNLVSQVSSPPPLKCSLFLLPLLSDGAPLYVHLLIYSALCMMHLKVK